MEYFAAGEKVGGLDVFEEVASGNSSCYLSPTIVTQERSRPSLLDISTIWNKV